MASRNGILVSTTLYHIGIMTLIAALAWVAIGAYTLASKPVNIAVDKDLLAPINPVLNKEVMSAIMQREKVEIDFVAPQPIEIDVITVTELNQSTASALPSGDTSQ